MTRALVRVWIGLVGVALVAATVVVAGLVPVAASSGHWAVTRAFLHFAMRRSVATHAAGIEPPDLEDADLIALGAGHFESGCRPCHGAPGEPPPPVPEAMTPAPPGLVGPAASWPANELFYVVRHGVKFTGMPAWPADGRDDEIWAVVAFLRALPRLDARAYEALVHGDVDARSRPVGADPAPDVVWSRCARCHGLHGHGRPDGAFPELAGQSATYLREALVAYAEGARASGVMRPIAAALDAREAAAAVTWYARQVPEAPTGDGSARGAEIAALGIPERGVPSCDACHVGSARHASYPSIGAQPRAYLVRQLELFVAGSRGGGPFAGVMEVATSHALEPDEIAAVAAHFEASARRHR